MNEKYAGMESANRHCFEHPPHVGPLEFFVRAKRLEKLIRDLDGPPFHALFAVKRSGWVLGVILSHALGLPMFDKAEIGHIPAKLENFLVVDTVSWTRRSVRRASSMLKKQIGFQPAAALLFVKKGRLFPSKLNAVAESDCDGIPRFFFHPDFRFDFCGDAAFFGEAGEIAGRIYPEYPKPPKS